MRIYLASGNAHKVDEFAALVRQYPLSPPPGPPELEIVVPAHLPAVVEDTGTFLGNARKKARALKGALPAEAWVLADDSGLGVDALDGGPGVESAYFAGPQGDRAANLRKLVEVMRDVPVGRRQAHFYCVLVLAGPTGVEVTFEGRCDGELALTPTGDGGFGYDPLFVPSGYACTYGELTEAEKNRLSHRARAWMRLVEWVRLHPVGR
jgi:XTP/dITP diphosphohydrolase